MERRLAIRILERLTDMSLLKASQLNQTVFTFVQTAMAREIGKFLEPEEIEAEPSESELTRAKYQRNVYGPRMD
jgi:hypothetical protein